MTTKSAISSQLLTTLSEQSNNRDVSDFLAQAECAYQREPSNFALIERTMLELERRYRDDVLLPWLNVHLHYNHNIGLHNFFLPTPICWQAVLQKPLRYGSVA